jgi:hypothetical protein
MLDLSFSMEAFERELHEYIIPEVVRPMIRWQRSQCPALLRNVDLCPLTCSSVSYHGWGGVGWGEIYTLTFLQALLFSTWSCLP